eukprot:2537686-Prymnesium_polylepis.1
MGAKDNYFPYGGSTFLAEPLSTRHLCGSILVWKTSSETVPTDARDVRTWPSMTAAGVGLNGALFVGSSRTLWATGLSMKENTTKVLSHTKPVR